MNGQAEMLIRTLPMICCSGQSKPFMKPNSGSPGPLCQTGQLCQESLAGFENHVSHHGSTVEQLSRLRRGTTLHVSDGSNDHVHANPASMLE